MLRRSEFVVWSRVCSPLRRLPCLCFLQGLAFFLPNMTWLQPPGHVHAMISQSWQPLAVNFSLSSGCPTSLNVSAGDVSVAASQDGSLASVRIVNDAAAELHVSVVMTPSGVSDPLAAASGTAVASVLQGSACAQNASFPYVSEHTTCANTPAQPDLFAPTSWERVPAAGLRVPSYSYAIVKAQRGG
jgi:cytochrome P450